MQFTHTPSLDIDMVERPEKWSRLCPECGTEFSSVQGWGECPQCELRFLVDYQGDLLDHGTRPDERAEGIALSDRTKKLISRLFSRHEGYVIHDMLYRAVSSNIPHCNNATPEGMERIRFAILKMTKSSGLNLAVGIYLAQTDWRELLMAAGFGDDGEQHLEWCDEQMKVDEV